MRALLLRTGISPRLTAALGLLAIVGLVIMACGGGANAGGTTTSGNAGSTSTSIAPKGPAKVGDTITVDGVSTTLVSVKPIKGDEFTQPKAGNEFIVVRIKMTNKSGNEQDYNEFDFHVKTGSGNITDSTIPPSTYTANNELNSGTLADGGTVTGDIIFEVPKGDHKAQLTWSPSFFSDKTSNAWSLGL